MFILEPLYSNNVGTAFFVKKHQTDSEAHLKIQLQVGDIAMLMDMEEIKALLGVIQSAKNGCQCKNCEKHVPCKTIKCNTPLADLIFKVTPSVLNGLEELVLGILFHKEYKGVLEDNQIYGLPQ